MKRYLMAALVALLCLVWSRVSAAFIPCEPGDRTWYCSADCQKIASDSPAWAEVLACGSGPEAAQVDAAWELGEQWECFVLDQGEPGPQDDIHCGECLEGEWCHPSGGFLPDGSPANQGGLLSFGYECVERAAIGSEPSHLDPTGWIYCDGGISDCDDRCAWGCWVSAWGSSDGSWIDGPEVMWATVQSGCDPLYEPSVEARAHERWAFLYPSLTPVGPTVCAPGLTGRVAVCEEPDPFGPQAPDMPDPGSPICEWLCNGQTAELGWIFRRQFPQSWWKTYMLPSEAHYGLPAPSYTSIKTFCSSDVGYDLAVYHAKKQAAAVWQHMLVTNWGDHVPRHWAEVDPNKTRCTEVEGEVP